MSQRALSLRLGEPPNYVHKIESGARGVDFVRAIELLRAIGTDPTDFVKDLLSRIDAL